MAFQAALGVWAFNFCGGFCVRKWQMQGKNMSQCHPLASVFNAADAVL